jgi:hypothetical protein
LPILKEQNMTHLSLHRSFPVATSERIAELFSATTLALSTLLGLVAVVTLATV